MRIIIGLILLIFTCSCSNNIKPNIESIEFSYYSYFDTSFTLQLNKPDTVLVKRKFHLSDIDFKSIITESEIEVAWDLIRNINFKNVDTVYDCQVEDGESIVLQFDQNGIHKKYIAKGCYKKVFGELVLGMKEIRRNLELKGIE